jgi:hypothetical protein
MAPEPPVLEFDHILELEDTDVLQTLRESWEEDLIVPGEFDVE